MRHNVFYFSLLRNKKVFSPVVLSGSRNCGGGCCCLGCQVYFHRSLRRLPEVSFLRRLPLPGSFPLFPAPGRLIRGEIAIAVRVYRPPPSCFPPPPTAGRRSAASLKPPQTPPHVRTKTFLVQCSGGYLFFSTVPALPASLHFFPLFFCDLFLFYPPL